MRFRADLLWCLRVIPIFLAPIRERPGDLGLLCAKLVVDMNPGRCRKIERLAPAALTILAVHAWPGNAKRERAAAALTIIRVTLWRRMRPGGLLGQR